MSRPRNIDVVESLRNDIVAGVFDHVPFLPAERELAERYETGRGVIRNALAELIEEHKLIRIPRRGIRLNQQKEKKRFRRFLLRLQTPDLLCRYEMSGLVAGLCEGANALCAEAILSCSPIPLNAGELKERFDRGDLQGVIFLELTDKSDLEAVAEAGLPYVITNLELEKNAACCRMDYRQIGRLAGQRLLQSGYRKIGVFSGPAKAFIFKEMLAGFRGALAEEEITLDPECFVDSDRPFTEKCIQTLRAILALPAGERPEAFFTMRDNRAQLLYQLAEEKHLKIPEDLAVISYDNITWPAGSGIGLTTISQEVQELGIRSIELLRDWYNSGVRPQDCVIAGKLIERKSLSAQKA